MPATLAEKEFFNKVISESFNCMLQRSKGKQYLNTKFDVIDGTDYTYIADPALKFRSKSVIYSWIQGRGAESLAGHLRNGFGEKTAVLEMLKSVVDSMEKVRKNNNGRMFFMFSEAGKFLNGDLSVRAQELEGNANYSDLFYSKGLVAAADALQDKELLEEAIRYFKQTLQAILNLEFVTDQQAFDPKNPVTAVPGKILQGPFMIALGGIAFAAELTRDEEFLDYGKKFIERLLTLHTVYKEDKVFFFEAVTPENTPYIDNNGQLCDPGHALEFVGLSMKFLLVMEKFNRACDQEFLAKCRKVYPAFFATHYAIGRQLPAGGIIKSYDLLSKKVINSDMPWWSLPETIRAAALLEKFCNMDNTQIIKECAAAFKDYFVNPEQHYFAYQTCDKNGEPVRVIPAVPDLDPGYHTNLSLLDVLNCN
ncbi:MAG: AGE family epimerase/isomerase [Lentisphaeria bacterium]|nr:AGE family epimerase/isomerase [Lentisphaeria bacterium]